MLSTLPRPEARRRNFSRPRPLRPPGEAPAQAAAARLGGGPDFVRGALRRAGGSILRVEVLIGVPEGKVATATFPLILKGVCERAEIEARARAELGGMTISVRCEAPDGFHPERADEEAPRPGDRDLHGIILVYPFAHSAVASLLRRNRAVSVLESYDGLDIDAVDTDDEAAVSALVGSLHEAGHSRIGFLSWDYPVGGHWVARRFNGFATGMCARGHGINGDWVINAGSGPRLSAEEAADKAARAVRDVGVTAWVCAADHQAYHLIKSLESRGIRVPRDCSVTGFDGLEAPAGLPLAASARVAHEHIGSSALTRMINRILYPSSSSRRILVSAHPVPGETIAAPRQP